MFGRTNACGIRTAIAKFVDMDVDLTWLVWRGDVSRLVSLPGDTDEASRTGSQACRMNILRLPRECIATACLRGKSLAPITPLTYANRPQMFVVQEYEHHEW